VTEAAARQAARARTTHRQRWTPVASAEVLRRQGDERPFPEQPPPQRI